MSTLRLLILFFPATWRHFWRKNCFVQASALTFTSLLALVPIMVVCVAILSFLPSFHSMNQHVQAFIFDNFVPDTGSEVQDYLSRFADNATHLSVIGLFFLLLTAVMLVLAMEKAFNHIWHIKARRRGVTSFLLYWSVLTLSPVLVSFSLLLSSYFLALPVVSQGAAWLGGEAVLLNFAPFIMLLLAFTLLFVVVPNERVPWRHGFFAAFLAATFFIVAKLGFVYYVQNFPIYHSIYGALSAVPLFLVWLYVSWVIILYGVVVTRTLTMKYPLRGGEPLDGFSHAFLWLQTLWEAKQKGRALSMSQLVKSDKYNYKVEPHELLRTLIKNKLVYRTSKDKYLLMADVSTLQLGDFHKMLPWKLPELKRTTENFGAFGQVVLRAELQALACMEYRLANLFEQKNIVRAL